MIFLYSSESQRSYVIFPEWTYLIHPDIELGSRPTHFCAEGRPEPTPPNATHLSQNTPQEDGTENLSEIVQCGVPKLKRNRVQLVHITNQFHYGLWYQNNYSIHGLHRPTNKHNSGAPHCNRFSSPLDFISSDFAGPPETGCSPVPPGS